MEIVFIIVGSVFVSLIVNWVCGFRSYSKWDKGE